MAKNILQILNTLKSRCINDTIDVMMQREPYIMGVFTRCGTPHKRLLLKKYRLRHFECNCGKSLFGSGCLYLYVSKKYVYVHSEHQNTWWRMERCW